MNSKIFDNWLNVSSKSFNKGINFGHKSIRLAKTTFWHPLLSHAFLGIRDQVSILTTQQTLKALVRAFHVMALIVKKQGHVLIINTNPEFFRLCNNLTHITLKEPDNYETAHAFGSNSKYRRLKTPLVSYVSYKWVGGTLTNWKQVSKSVLTFAKFSERCERFLIKKTLDFPKYTKVKKCFQGLLYRENNKLFLAFRRKPDVVFLINPNENQSVLTEASRLQIPVIAFIESNTNPKDITYPIPVNNYSIKFIYFCLKKIIKMTTIH